MLLPSCHLLVSRCPWRQAFLRPLVFLHRRHLTSSKQQRELRRFNHKVKETVYSLVVVTGVVALGSLCYVILHEFYSRETPNGIYREASQLCLANSDVQDALGVPIVVHTTPDVDATRLNNVRAKMFDEKGRQSMTLSFYLTGRDRAGVVGLKVQKNISNRFLYEYILVQLDRPWQGQNIIQVHRAADFSSMTPNL